MLIYAETPLLHPLQAVEQDNPYEVLFQCLRAQSVPRLHTAEILVGGKAVGIMGSAVAERQPQGDEQDSEKNKLLGPSFYAENRRMTLAMTTSCQKDGRWQWHQVKHTVQRNDTEDEDDGQSHDHDRIDLEPRGLISVQPYTAGLAGYSRGVVYP
jgi:hypothetical protein